MITIYSLIPSMKDKSGHSYEYNNILTNAACINNWSHIKIVPKICQLDEKNNGWQKSIYSLDQKNKIKNFRNFFPFFKIFKKIKKDKNSVLFLEDFTIVVLFLCFVCMFLLRPKMRLWLLFRYEHDVMIKKGKFCKYIMYLFEFLLGKRNVTYLSDSKLISQKNGEFFKRNFEVLPIAHTNVFSKKSNIKKEKISFWWPGVCREEKGFSRIQKLAKLLKVSIEKNITLELSESVKNKIFFSNCLNFLKTHLSRDEYELKMFNTDIILLPYSESSYRYRTSGIFVEAIVSKVIPAVSKNTWMAKELIKYNLKELIIDWEDDNLLKKLVKLTESKKIKEKINLMSDEYIKIHNLENFAKVLKKISNTI